MLVAVEVRYPDVSPRVEHARHQLRDRVADVLPLQNHDLFQEEYQIADGAVRRRQHNLHQFIGRDRATAATFVEDRLIVETTDYHGFPTLLPLLQQLFRVLAEEVKPTAVERVGLRYIDEVRVDSSARDPDHHGWESWIHPALVSPGAFDPQIEGLHRRDWRGRINFDWDRHSRMVLRYGPNHGYATDPERIPRRLSPPASGGPYFLIDLDCYWHQTDDAPPFEPDIVTERCQHLHQPIRSTFEASITDRLREEVLNKGAT